MVAVAFDVRVIGPDGENDLTEDGEAAVVDTLVRLSDLYSDYPWIAEADVYPPIVHDDGAVAVDALFVGPD